MSQLQRPSILADGPTLHLADRLFLAAHGSVSANLQISPHTLIPGLGGAMFAELVLAGRLDVRRLHAEHDVSQIKVVAEPHRDAPRLDRVGAALLAEIKDNPDTTDVHSWLAFLATPRPKGDSPYTWIGDRLVEQNVLTYEFKRRFLTRTKVYYPVGAKPQLAMTGLLSRIVSNKVLTVHERVLAGLIFAVGLDGTVFKDVADDVIDRLRSVVEHFLPTPFSCIVGEVESIVGDSVIKSRY